MVLSPFDLTKIVSNWMKSFRTARDGDVVFRRFPGLPFHQSNRQYGEREQSERHLRRHQELRPRLQPTCQPDRGLHLGRTGQRFQQRSETGAGKLQCEWHSRGFESYEGYFMKAILWRKSCEGY